MIGQYCHASRTPARALHSSSISHSEFSRWPIWKSTSGHCSCFTCFDSSSTVKSFSCTQRLLIGNLEPKDRSSFGSTFICNSEKKSFSEETITMYFDGGSRGNPGPGGSGSILEDTSGKRIWQGFSFLGVVTNNQAEYDGLIKGLTAAKEAGMKNLEVYGDSNLVIEQMKGNWQVKANTLRPLHTEARALIRYFNKVSFKFIRRENNSVADNLVNSAIDCECDQSQWCY